MSDLRDTIARAMQHSNAWMGCDDEGWTCPGKECRYCWEVAQGCADAVIATLGLYEETYECTRLCDETPRTYRRYVNPWTEED